MLDGEAMVKIHISFISRLLALGDGYEINKYLGTNLDKESLPLDRIEVVTSRGNVSKEKTNQLRSVISSRVRSPTNV